MQGSPTTFQVSSASVPAVSTTPRVASTAERGATAVASSQVVSSPPEKRMRLSAITPSDCATPASSK